MLSTCNDLMNVLHGIDVAWRVAYFKHISQEEQLEAMAEAAITGPGVPDLYKPCNAFWRPPRSSLKLPTSHKFV